MGSGVCRPSPGLRLDSSLEVWVNAAERALVHTYCVERVAQTK